MEKCRNADEWNNQFKGTQKKENETLLNEVTLDSLTESEQLENYIAKITQSEEYPSGIPKDITDQWKVTYLNMLADKDEYRLNDLGISISGYLTDLKGEVCES